MPSLIEAIEKKYSQLEEHVPKNFFMIFAPKAGARDCVPSILVLNDCDVDSAGEEERLANLCLNVHEIDLSHNKLVKWTEVLKILQQTPSATFVNLSFNGLSSPLDNSLTFTLPKLESLILIGTNVEWNSVWALLQAATNLKELHLSLNQFDSVKIPDSGTTFESITKLTFDGNPIVDWKEISKLGVIFPQLKQLSLSDCPIRFQFDADLVHENFKCLEILNVSNTLIETCDEVVRINTFPALTEIRTSGIPFLLGISDKDRRQELIALLPKIRKLNGGALISEEEKDTSERFFLRKYLDIDPKPAKYFELLDKHGQLDPLVEVKLKPVTKMNLKIKFGEMEVYKIINLYQSVRDLKKLLEPIVGIQSSRMRLFHIDVGKDFGGTLLNFPDKQLYSCNMHEGDMIEVQLKNSTNREIDM